MKVARRNSTAKVEYQRRTSFSGSSDDVDTVVIEQSVLGKKLHHILLVGWLELLLKLYFELQTIRHSMCCVFLFSVY